MATTTWTGQNGNWTDSTWTNGVPDASLDAIVDGTSLDPITVNIDAPNGAAHSLSMAYATLAMSGYQLTLESASSLDALNQSDGELEFAAGGTISGPVSQTGGVIRVDSGSLVVEDGGSFGGELFGSGGAGSIGEVVLAGGTATLEPSLLSDVSLVIEDTTILAGNLTGGNAALGYTSLAATGTLDLAGFALDIGFESVLSGLIEGPGTLNVLRNSEWTGLTTAGSLTLDVVGSIDLDGLLTLGSSPSDETTLISDDRIDVEDGGSIAVRGTDTIFNNGIFSDHAPGTLSLAGDIVNSSTFMAVGSGPGQSNTIAFNQGTFTDTGEGGVLAAGGNISFGPDVTNNALVNGTLIGDWFAENGTISFTGSPIVTLAGTVEIEGEGLKQNSNYKLGAIVAGEDTGVTSIQNSLSTIAVGGALELGPQVSFHSKRNLVDYGTFTIGGSDGLGTLWIGPTGQLGLASGATLAADAIRSAGTVVAGGSVLEAPLISMGTLLVEGTLELDGAGNRVGGSISGPGVLTFGSGTANTIEPGTHGNIAKVVLDSGASLAFAGDLVADKSQFTADSGSTIDLGGHAVSLTHSALLGDASAPVLVEGGGTLSDIGSMGLGDVQFTGGTELVATPHAGPLSALSQTGTVTLGDASGGTASLTINANATYTMEGAVAIDAADPATDTVTNAGVFEKTGDATAIVGSAFTNTGTIDVAQGTLEITGAFVNTGKIIGTESQSNGTTFITAPAASPALFNQAVAATSAAGTTNPAFTPPPAAITPTLAQPAV